jgi:hypothetical protein
VCKPPCAMELNNSNWTSVLDKSKGALGWTSGLDTSKGALVWTAGLDKSKVALGVRLYYEML